MFCERQHTEIPDYVLAALDALEMSGAEAWLVGGCVRDTLLGRDVNDYDIATSVHWTVAEQILLDAGFGVHRIGVKHGTIAATFDGASIEVTTYRQDGTYADGRHPDSVTFVGNIEDDLARRDFTINALAYHPKRGLIDCCNGIGDLNARAIRAVGDPHKRFAEDGLRIARGCRFASQLGFSIEPSTLQAMKACKKALMRVSSERITHELDALLLGEHVHDALVETVDVLCAVLPEIASCKGFDQKTPYHIYDVWEHIAWVVQRSPATRLARWAALFHDIGKPAACFEEHDRRHFYGHAFLSADLARGAMQRLKMAPSFVNRVIALVLMHDDQIAANPRSVRRALAALDGDVDMLRTLIGIKRSDALAQSQLAQPRIELADELDKIVDDVIEQGQAFTVAQLAINGNDVLVSGIPEGPEVGRLLDLALEAVIDGRVANSREDLLKELMHLIST